MKISIVCVNYNSYDSLEKYLKSLKNALALSSNVELYVYVADNSTEKKDLNSKFNFDVKVFSYNNLGYFGGAFEVINTNKEIRTSDYVIISNVDLQVDENFFLELQKAKVDNDTGWIAPQIYSCLEKRDKNPQRIKRPSKKKMEQLLFMFKHPLLQRIYKNTFYQRKKNNHNFESYSQIYCGHGSFIILTNRFINVINNFHYPCFLYCEELFLGELIKLNSLKTIYIPSIKILDDEHVSTGNLPGKSYYYYNLEALKYIKKTFY